MANPESDEEHVRLPQLGTHYLEGIGVLLPIFYRITCQYRLTIDPLAPVEN